MAEAYCSGSIPGISGAEPASTAREVPAPAASPGAAPPVTEACRACCIWENAGSFAICSAICLMLGSCITIALFSRWMAVPSTCTHFKKQYGKQGKGACIEYVLQCAEVKGRHSGETLPSSRHWKSSFLANTGSQMHSVLDSDG